MSHGTEGNPLIMVQYDLVCANEPLLARVINHALLECAALHRSGTFVGIIHYIHVRRVLEMDKSQYVWIAFNDESDRHRAHRIVNWPSCIARCPRCDGRAGGCAYCRNTGEVGEIDG